MTFKSKLLAAIIIIFIILMMSLFGIYRYVSWQHNQHVLNDINSQVALKQKNIKKMQSLAAENILQKKKHYLSVHKNAVRLFKQNPSQSLTELQNTLQKKYKMAPDTELFLINRKQVVYDATFTADIGLDLSIFPKTSNDISKAFNSDEIILSDLISKDPIDSHYKIYSYAGVDDDTILELSFIDHQSSDFFKLNQTAFDQYKNIKVQLYGIFEDENQGFFYLIKSMTQQGNEKKKIFEKSKFFNRKNDNNDPIAKAFFNEPVSYEDKENRTYYLYVRLFDNDIKHMEVKNLVVKYSVPIDDKHVFLNAIKRIFLISLFIAFVVFVLFYYFLQKQFVSPIERIMQSMRANKHVPIKDFRNPKDEFFLIAKAYNDTHSQLSNEIQKNKNNALMDSLTQVGNRKAFDNHLGFLIDDLAESNDMFSLMVFDIDDFKKINDKFGHLKGDKVLKELTKLVVQMLENGDELFRIGGEEFAVLFKDKDAKSAKEIADSVQVAVSNYFLGSKVERVTISGGVSEFKMNDTYESLYKRVDGLLYVAKNSGKNKICVG